MQCQISHWESHKKLCKRYQTQNSAKLIDLFAAKNVTNNTAHLCVKRIDVLLDVYQQFIQNNGKYGKHDDIYELICSHYPGSKIDHFISDHSKYAQSIDDNNVYKKNANTCNFASCPFIKREYRGKIYDIDETQRFKLYEYCKSEDSIIVQQLLDQIHILKFHLIDMGLRHINSNESRNESSGNKEINQMRQELMAKRDVFNKIRADNDNIAKPTNKFVTELLNEDSKNDNNTINNQVPYPIYSHGVRFYYHTYYQHNKTRQEILPGTSNILERGNAITHSSYSYGDWFIAQKYKSIKEEVLQSRHLTQIQYGNTLKKAMFKHRTLSKNIRGANFLWRIVYGIKTGSPIPVNHIFAVLLYTNHTNLSAHFSSSFRKLSTSETDLELKRRHSEFANWAKALREAVECWGTYFDETDTILKVFHGVSCKMMFDKFKQEFCAPTSTTLQYSTAVMFASQGDGDGIVVMIRNNKMAASFFNCISWSDFAAESEMLFVGGFQMLEIGGLTSLGDGLNYDEWIQAMRIFQGGIIGGCATDKPITSKDCELISLLVGDISNSMIPRYIADLFQNVTQSAKGMTICLNVIHRNVDYYKADIGQTFYGYKSLKHPFVNAENYIDWDVIHKLFPSITTIYIQRVVKLPNDSNAFKYGPSVLINDVLMLNILEFVTGKYKLKDVFAAIIISNPLNKKMHVLKAIVRKYSPQFNKVKYKLLVKKVVDNKYGACVRFYVAYFSISV